MAKHEKKALSHDLVDAFVQIGTSFTRVTQSFLPGLTPVKLGIALITFVVAFEFLGMFMKMRGSYSSRAFKMITALPLVNKILDKQIDDAVKNIKEAVHGKIRKNHLMKLPEVGMPCEKIKSTAASYRNSRELKWEQGFASGTVYANNPQLEQLMTEIFKDTMWTNPLHPDIFPDIRRMEAEIVRMVLSMYHGDENSCGTMTSGGTESIIMACKAFKERAVQAGIQRPNIICPQSAHAAFDKAADYFEMDLIHIPCNGRTRKADVAAMECAINSSTCMLVASAPSFPHGVIDSVEEISELGLKYNIPVHVDCCLGGFLLPFMEEAGFNDVPLFDFRLPGVTSISCDTHKYGFAPKGTSVIMYRDTSFRELQFFVAPNWSGGVYASPTIAGSRPGALIALTWAALVFHGQKGYVASTHRIISTTRKIARELAKIPGIRVLGDPKVSVVGFTSDDFDIYRLSAAMSKRPGSGTSWSLNTLQFPSSVHICVTDRHTDSGRAEAFLYDVREIAQDLIKSKDAKSTGMAAIYGMSQMIPDRSLVAGLAKKFLVACYETPNVEPECNGDTKKKK